MKILISDPNLIPHADVIETGVPAGCTVRWLPGDDPEFAAALTEADVLVGAKLTAEQAGTAPRLRLVHAPGAGVDGIDQDALGPDTIVANTFHHEDSIAEQVVASAVVLRRGLLTQDRELRRDVWAGSVHDRSIPQPRNLRGARIGFVGFGHIGRRCWELLSPFGCTGAAVTGSGRITPSLTESTGGTDSTGATGAETTELAWHGRADTDLERLLTQSDVLVVSAPLNEHTRDLIGAAELALLPSDAIVINVGRGPLINPDALHDSLAGQRIGGAAIDVWYSYPDASGRGRPAEQDFASLPNTLLTPHSSGVTAETFAGRAADIAANITALSQGRPLRNVVRPDPS